MPLINVHLAETPTDEVKLAFMRALTDAAVETLGVSVESVRVWITPIAESDFMSAGVPLSQRRAEARQKAAAACRPDGHADRGPASTSAAAQAEMGAR